MCASNSFGLRLQRIIIDVWQPMLLLCVSTIATKKSSRQTPLLVRFSFSICHILSTPNVILIKYAQRRFFFANNLRNLSIMANSADKRKKQQNRQDSYRAKFETNIAFEDKQINYFYLALNLSDTQPLGLLLGQNFFEIATVLLFHQPGRLFCMAIFSREKLI